MPATGTPEPGGLSWYEILALLRATIAKKNVVACDVVELSPLPGVMAPNFLCAKLIYKILTYRFAAAEVTGCVPRSGIRAAGFGGDEFRPGVNARRRSGRSPHPGSRMPTA